MAENIFELMIPCDSYTERDTGNGVEYILSVDGRDAVRVTKEDIPDDGTRPKSRAARAGASR